MTAQKLQTIQNSTKTAKTALLGKIGKVCVTECFYNAKEWKPYVQPRAETTWSSGHLGHFTHQSLEAHGPVTWSGHMVYRTVKSNST